MFNVEMKIYISVLETSGPLVTLNLEILKEPFLKMTIKTIFLQFKKRDLDMTSFPVCRFLQP